MSVLSPQFVWYRPNAWNVLMSVVTVFLLSCYLPATIVSGQQELTALDSTQEVHLLRVEHYVYLTAADDAPLFHLQFVFPPVYGYQVPVFLEIHNDTNATIQTYKIKNDTSEPNLLVEFTMGPLYFGETRLVHFSCWVLVQNHSFNDLPVDVAFPSADQLPNATKKWLVSTPVVQVKSRLLVMTARLLRIMDENVITYAQKVAWFIKNHRYGLFLLQLNLDVFLPQDALTTLFFNGDNVGRSHLACALFRSMGIPARVVLAHNDQGFWTQMHYMVEYYVPGYGWVLLDSTKGETPYATKRQVFNRICYPEDENNTKVDYIFRFMFGEERWLWLDSTLVTPYYLDCTNGSRSQMFDEGYTIADTTEVQDALSLTKNVFHLYKQYLGMSLTGENLEYYTEAVHAQKIAVAGFADIPDLPQYIHLLEYAYTQYLQIHV